MSDKLIKSPRNHTVQAYLNWLLENATTPYITLLYFPDQINVPGHFASLLPVPVQGYDRKMAQWKEYGGRREMLSVTLNISSGAVGKYLHGENSISMSARFNNVAMEIDIPYEYVYAFFDYSDPRIRMELPVDLADLPAAQEPKNAQQVEEPTQSPRPRPTLTRVK